jgi:hypothetical protein
MTTLQAVFLGMMLSWTPSLILMAWLLWQAESEFEDRKTEWQSRY